MASKQQFRFKSLQAVVMMTMGAITALTSADANAITNSRYTDYGYSDFGLMMIGKGYPPSLGFSMGPTTTIPRPSKAIGHHLPIAMAEFPTAVPPVQAAPTTSESITTVKEAAILISVFHQASSKTPTTVLLPATLTVVISVRQAAMRPTRSSAMPRRSTGLIPATMTIHSTYTATRSTPLSATRLK